MDFVGCWGGDGRGDDGDYVWATGFGELYFADGGGHCDAVVLEKLIRDMAES